jgi:hypothetical protein
MTFDGWRLDKYDNMTHKRFCIFRLFNKRGREREQEREEKKFIDEKTRENRRKKNTKQKIKEKKHSNDVKRKQEEVLPKTFLFAYL